MPLRHWNRPLMAPNGNISLRPTHLEPNQKIEFTLTDPATLRITLPRRGSRILNEMRTAKRAVIRFNDTARVQITFDDGTDSPYSIDVTPNEFVDGKLPEEGALKHIVVHGHDTEESLLDLPVSAESTYGEEFLADGTVLVSFVPELDLLVVVRVQ
jgi:hypothetical protein